MEMTERTLEGKMEISEIETKEEEEITVRTGDLGGIEEEEEGTRTEVTGSQEHVSNANRWATVRTNAQTKATPLPKTTENTKIQKCPSKKSVITEQPYICTKHSQIIIKIAISILKMR